MTSLEESLVVGGVIAGCLLISIALAAWAWSRHRDRDGR
jgi:hypothetical protein